MQTPKDFKCRRCGSCCSICPFLTDEDIKRVVDLGYKEDYFVEKTEGKKFMKLVNGSCIFLEKKGKITSCKIYSARPQTCREYPTKIKDNGNCRPEFLKFNKK